MRCIRVLSLVLTLVATYSCLAQQRPGGPPTPKFSKSFVKLFGENKAFTAGALMEVKMQEGTVSMPSKIAFLDGKTRLEMDVSKMKGGAVPPQAMEQMKQMGMVKW